MHVEQDRFIQMTQSPLKGLILRMAVPSMASMLVTAIYNMVDTYFVGFIGTSATGAVGREMMKVLAANGDMDALKVYLDELDTDLNTVDTVVKTGNPMADAILNSKISLARSRNIPTQVDAHIPVKLKMSELDLCCIIGNLFDNAIEASVKLPEEQRLIRVYMDMKSTQLYISFTNFTADKKLKKEGRLFRSTKGEGHGFGLVRIDAIVERLDGYISRNSEDGAFTTEILLPQV